MLKRHYITPENTYKVGGNKQVIYTPVIVVEDDSAHSHIYLAGRTSRTLDGDVACKGDMRGQIREVCIAMQLALESVGATLAERGFSADQIRNSVSIKCLRSRHARPLINLVPSCSWFVNERHDVSVLLL